MKSNARQMMPDEKKTVQRWGPVPFASAPALGLGGGKRSGLVIGSEGMTIVG
jgi:hypothetical protein